jgi:NhaP-type Na+/H+ or K+/H+ antiporter
VPLEFEIASAPAVLAAFGLVALGMALLPRLLHQRPLSFPLIYVLAGWALSTLPIRLPTIDPLVTDKAALHLTEVGVIVALFGVGLKVGRPCSIKGWAQTWRLLGIAMPITVGAGAGLAAWWLGFDVAPAVLFGAVLAPTDPVLASDVQQTSPEDEGPGDVRFTLTSEAGLNDALAFPFTMLALAIAAKGTDPGEWLTTWLAVDVVYRLAVGLAFGWLFGRLLRAMVFRIPLGERRLAETGEGLVAIAGTFLTYGVTEVAEGYGFLAVFVAAQVLRAYETDHEYHEVVHDFAEQIERLVNGVVLVLLGAAISDGLLAPLTPAMVAVAFAMILLVRPLSSLVALGGVSDGRWIMSFFGIRGVGSFFYLAYALSKGDFGIGEELWAVVGFTVLLSITIHGFSAGPIMTRHDEEADEEPDDGSDDCDDDRSPSAA